MHREGSGLHRPSDESVVTRTVLAPLVPRRGRFGENGSHHQGQGRSTLRNLALCRADRVEPQARIDRILGSARASFERLFTATIAGRISDSSAERLEQLAGDDGPDGALGGGVSFLTELKADPGQLGLETMLKEIAKLERVRAVGNRWPLPTCFLSLTGFFVGE